MINLRAGLIYNISHKKITKQHVNEIFYWSNNPKYISVLKMIEEILLIDPNINYTPPIDFNVTAYFGDYYKVAYDYLKNVGINVLAYYFFEHCKFQMIVNPISSWNKNTKGQKQEKSAIFKFNNVYGYSIQKIKRSSYVIKDHNLSISGTPDGIVKSSPGGIFDDHIVEIKCQLKINDECKERNRFQIACYSKIFNKPVLLIIYNGGQYVIYRFSIESLDKCWNNQILPKLIKGVDSLKDIITVNNLSDLKKYNSYVDSFEV